LSEPERLVDGDDPDLLALGADEPDLGSANALVNARFDADVTSTGSSFPAVAGLSGGGLRCRGGEPAADSGLS